MLEKKSGVLHLVLIIILTLGIIILTIGTFTLTNSENYSDFDEDKYVLYNGYKYPKFNIENKEIVLLSHLTQNDLIDGVEDFEKIYDVKVINKRVNYKELPYEVEKSVASGEKIDIAVFSEEMFPIAFAKDLFLPLNDILTLGDSSWLKTKTQSQAYSYQGKTFVLGKPSCDRVFWYNKRLFSEQGVKSPGELFKEGNWTWESLSDIAKKMSIRNKEGELEQIGILGNNLATSVLASKNVHLKTITPEGIRNSVNDPNVAFSMNYIYNLFSNQDFIYFPNETETSNEFIQGYSAILHEGIWIISQPKYSDMIKRNEIDFVPMPKWEGSEMVLYSDSFTGFVMPKTSENIEGVIAFFTYKKIYNDSMQFIDKQVNLMEKYKFDKSVIENYIEFKKNPIKQSMPICNLSSNPQEEWQIFSWLLDNKLKWNMIKLRASSVIDEKIEEFNNISASS